MSPAGRRRDRLDLLFESRDLLVVNKPAGLLTIPSAPGRHEHEDTLLGRVLAFARHKHGRRAYAGVLHRLDRGTSGALAVALTREVHAAGRALFKAHRFERTYLALVHGAPEPSGVIDKPISSAYVSGRRQVADREGEALPARTRFRLARAFGRRAALLEVTLETGRQHQIRLHLASIGHPVMGDAVYGELRRSAKRGDRPLLHAWRLRFPHPLTDAAIAVEAKIPRDMQRMIARLELDGG